MCRDIGQKRGCHVWRTKRIPVYLTEVHRRRGKEHEMTLSTNVSP